MMDKDQKVVIVGAGIFGLSTAYQLASEGYRNVVVLDRHMPPVPDGSSNDISRIVRFDYADEDYVRVAHEAYQRWRNLPKYRGIFHPTRFLQIGTRSSSGDNTWADKTTAQLTKRGLPWKMLNDADAAKRVFPEITGAITEGEFVGYHHEQAGWADAAKAVSQLRDDCIEAGVSFICGPEGTVTGFEMVTRETIWALRTAAGTLVQGDHFILAAGAWTTGLVNMYNSTLSTGQVVGFVRLTDAEMERYKDNPVCLNFSTGWFCFPPHKDGNYLKFAVHGWGYTRAPGEDVSETSPASLPPTKPRRQRANFAPADGEQRLRDGLRMLFPELADRPFDKVAMCWYTDTPTGDFIMDYHPGYKNLFIGGGGSGHAFKFLPVLGEYMSLAIKKQLPAPLASKWRFRTEHQGQRDTFVGDGSRGGPARRELDADERAKLAIEAQAKL